MVKPLCTTVRVIDFEKMILPMERYKKTAPSDKSRAIAHNNLGNGKKGRETVQTI
jgi:hypothetical protein